MTSNKLTKALAAAGFGLLLMAGSANASVTFFPPVTGFEDDNLDFFVDMGNGLATTLDVGDRLVAVVKFNRTFGLFGGGPGNIAPAELTGISDITVTSKVAVGAGLFNFTFGPSVGFQGNTAVDVAGGLGKMVALWLDGTPNLTLVPPNCNDLATCSAAASDGTLWLEAGFAGDVNEFWFAGGATDTPSLLANVAGSTKAGAINFALSAITNNTGQTILPQFCANGLPVPLGCPAGGDGSVDIIGSGDLLGGQGLPATILADGGFARSDTDFQLRTQVPEPGTLSLLALALLGLGASARRRKS